MLLTSLLFCCCCTMYVKIHDCWYPACIIHLLQKNSNIAYTVNCNAHLTENHNLYFALKKHVLKDQCYGKRRASTF